MKTQTTLDLSERITLPDAEKQYNFFKHEKHFDGDKLHIVKDATGYLVTLFYSDDFLKTKGFEIIK